MRRLFYSYNIFTGERRCRAHILREVGEGQGSTPAKFAQLNKKGDR
jgi:hypothetical protein